DRGRPGAVRGDDRVLARDAGTHDRVGHLPLRRHAPRASAAQPPAVRGAGHPSARTGGGGGGQTLTDDHGTDSQEQEETMTNRPPVIDADGHLLERQSDIRKYLPEPWNRRNTPLFPSDQPWDSDLFDTLGSRWYSRNASPAEQVELWHRVMDEHG